MSRFSRRHGLTKPAPEVKHRDSLPQDVRYSIAQVAYDLGFSPAELRALVCGVLKKRPLEEHNWGEENVRREVNDLLMKCEWFEAFDVVEEIARLVEKGGRGWRRPSDEESPTLVFHVEINRVFIEHGVGWQLSDGLVEMRGSETFEKTIHDALQQLDEGDRRTAGNELREALHDLSRRPKPDITGAIQHAMAAIECVARDQSNDTSLTLGEIVRRHPELFPKPMDQVVTKAWGFSSEVGRHLEEGQEPNFEEAELLVGLSGLLCRYLTRKAEK